MKNDGVIKAVRDAIEFYEGISELMKADEAISQTEYVERRDNGSYVPVLFLKSGGMASPVYKTGKRTSKGPENEPTDAGSTEYASPEEERSIKSMITVMSKKGIGRKLWARIEQDADRAYT